jgi:hypothetical protein
MGERCCHPALDPGRRCSQHSGCDESAERPNDSDKPRIEMARSSTANLFSRAKAPTHPSSFDGKHLPDRQDSNHEAPDPIDHYRDRFAQDGDVNRNQH